MLVCCYRLRLCGDALVHSSLYRRESGREYTAQAVSRGTSVPLWLLHERLAHTHTRTHTHATKAHTEPRFYPTIGPPKTVLGRLFQQTTEVLDPDPGRHPSHSSGSHPLAIAYILPKGLRPKNIAHGGPLSDRFSALSVQHRNHAVVHGFVPTWSPPPPSPCLVTASASNTLTTCQRARGNNLGPIPEERPSCRQRTLVLLTNDWPPSTAVSLIILSA